MATSTFDKVFVIKGQDQKRLLKIINSGEPAVPGELPLYTQADRDASEKTLLQWCSHFSN